MMMTQFLHSNLWTEITSLANKAKRKYAAVAYLGADATELLLLTQDDVLVVNMSLETVRAGQTSPAEIEKYLARGVEVHSCSNLHAKVFIFDGMAIVGSANVSKNSRDHLIEAALLTTDEAVVNSVRDFILSLRGELVTPMYVETCKKEYRPPSFPASKPSPNVPAHSRLRVERVYPAEFDSQEERVLVSGLKAAEKELKDAQLYTVEGLRFDERSMLAKTGKVGDLVIQIWEREDGELWVYPPSRVIFTQPYVRSRDGAHPVFVYLEVPKSAKLLAWREFKDALQKGGIARVSKRISREIANARLKHQLLGLWQ